MSKKRDDWLHYNLLEWGAWRAKNILGIGWAAATIEARCMEYGADGARSGTDKGPIIPYYWPNRAVRRVHGFILTLSDVDQGALHVRYVENLDENRAGEALQVSPRAYWYRLDAARERLRSKMREHRKREKKKPLEILQ